VRGARKWRPLSSAAAAAAAPAPAGATPSAGAATTWRECTHTDGRKYYVNRVAPLRRPQRGQCSGQCCGREGGGCGNVCVWRQLDFTCWFLDGIRSI